MIDQNPAKGVSFSAVILAAGRSSRMGSDKALLTASGGKKLWERQREVLKQAGAMEIFLSAREEQVWARVGKGIEDVLRDVRPDLGPLAGIARALERMTATHLVVLAVDLLELPAVWFEQLARQCAIGRGAVGKRGEFFEPLAAIYPRELAPVAAVALARGEYAVQRFVATAVARGAMSVRTIGPAELPWFQNWNQPRK